MRLQQIMVGDRIQKDHQDHDQILVDFCLIYLRVVVVTASVGVAWLPLFIDSVGCSAPVEVILLFTFVRQFQQSRLSYCTGNGNFNISINRFNPAYWAICSCVAKDPASHFDSIIQRNYSFCTGGWLCRQERLIRITYHKFLQNDCPQLALALMLEWMLHP